MNIFCSDLEGVWVPEVWVNVAKITGIDELKLTTRDISDYDVLMKQRISILKAHNLTLSDIQKVISNIKPLPGAKELLDWIRSTAPIHIVSDTFVEFASPLMVQLGQPSLFCNHLSVSPEGIITDYHLRQKDQKREVVKALRSLNYKVIAFGDSYNDISMLQEAESGILFCPPQCVIDDYPQFPVVTDYIGLKKLLIQYI